MYVRMPALCGLRFCGVALVVVILVMTCLAAPGCSRPDDASHTTNAADEGSAENAAQTPTEPSPGRPDATPGAVSTGVSPTESSQLPAPKPSAMRPNSFALADREDSTATARMPIRELRPDLSPEKLVEFLAGADQDIQTIVLGRSGIEDPQEARDLLVRIIQMKLEAARRLADHSDANAEIRSEGNRGQLQALSHLASLGDLKVAKELKLLAEQNLSSDDPKLVTDSRLVLIGFAIEGLQNGDQGASRQILQYVDQIAHSKSEPDVPAMMVMGQARQILASYGHDEEALRVRNTIIDLFADSPQPEIAQMAAQLAGNVRFDAIEKMRARIMDGETVSATQWREAVERLIDESADMQTVQYLAGAAIEFESIKKDGLLQTTYEVLSRRFDDPASAVGKEIQLAIAARQARQKVVGQIFDPDLPSTSGAPLSLKDVRGQVVLMPFWAMSFPESLQIVSSLKSIRDSHSGDVVIVGMNIDAEGAPVAEFLRANPLGFDSFRAESSPTLSVPNPVAAQFGLVSMPFVVILDVDGRVAEINLTGRNLDQTVEELIDRE